MKSFDDALRVALSPASTDGLGCSEAFYRYASGEGTPETKAAFRQHLESCADCREDLEAYQKSAPAPKPGRRFSPAFWIRGLSLATACAGVILFLKLRAPDAPRDTNPTILAAKGAASFHVAVVRDGKTLTWAGADHLAPRDELRFSYSAATAVYPVVFFADETGAVERLFPSGEPALVEPGNGAMGAAEVDSQPGCQWFIAFFFGAERAPNLDALSAAVKQALGRRSPGGCNLGGIEVGGVEAQVRSKQVALP